MIRSVPAIRTVLLALTVAALGGCAQPGGRAPVLTEVRHDDVALRAVLAYARSAEKFDAPTWAREIKDLAARDEGARTTMQMAVLYGQPRSEGDPARAAALLEKVLASESGDAALFHPLARILHAQFVARVRLAAQNERLLADQHAAQDQVDALQKKLDALTDIERSLPASPVRSMETPR